MTMSLVDYTIVQRSVFLVILNYSNVRFEDNRLLSDGSLPRRNASYGGFTMCVQEIDISTSYVIIGT